MNSNLVCNLLKDIPDKELEEFFEQEFLKPLLSQLDGGSEPAEKIRHQRQQTKKILQIIKDLKKK